MSTNIDTKNLIFGRNPVKEAFKANRVVSVYVIENFSHKEILDYINSSKVKVTKVTPKELDNICQGVHQGIAANIKPYNYVSLEEIAAKPSKIPNRTPVILLLDGINDPQNLGAILRSADIFGVSGVVIPKHNQVQLNAIVAKTSAGAINYVPVALVSNLNQAAEYLKQRGFWTVASDGSASMNYQDIKYDFPVALIIGSEGNGVSRLLKERSDYVIKIPMQGHVNSLNVSVATGIILSMIRN